MALFLTIGGSGANQKLGLVRWIDGDVRLFVVKYRKKRIKYSMGAVVR